MSPAIKPCCTCQLTTNSGSIVLPLSLVSAVELLTRLKDESPQFGDYRQWLARCLREQSRGIQSRQLSQSIALLEKLCEAYPQVADYRHDLIEAYAHFSLWGIDDRNEWLSLGETRLRSAIHHAQQLVISHPQIPEYRGSQARVYEKLGQLLEVRVNLGRLAE